MSQKNASWCFHGKTGGYLTLKCPECLNDREFTALRTGPELLWICSRCGCRNGLQLAETGSGLQLTFSNRASTLPN